MTALNSHRCRVWGSSRVAVLGEHATIEPYRVGKKKGGHCDYKYIGMPARYGVQAINEYMKSCVQADMNPDAACLQGKNQADTLCIEWRLPESDADPARGAASRSQYDACSDIKWSMPPRVSLRPNTRTSSSLQTWNQACCLHIV